MRYFLFLLAAFAGAAPAMAENRAVVIGNADYRHAPDLAGWDTGALARAMRSSGFTTAEGIDLPTVELRQTLDLVARADADGGARIVALSGRFVHSREETWFLGVEADRPGPEALPSVAVPLSLIMGVMARSSQGAVLLLGSDQQAMPHQAGLESGIGDLPEIAGVSVIHGGSEAVARALRELAAGGSVAKALAAGRGLREPGSGEAGLTPVKPGKRLATLPEPSAVERNSWADSVASDSLAGYGAYLRRYPAGAFSGAASWRMADLQQRRARSAANIPATPTHEAALKLSRDERIVLQRNLARLGHDPGGADGFFGLRTRQSLSEWQERNGHAATGFLSEEQIRQMSRQVAELDAAQAEGAGGFWQRLGEKRDENRLWAYLTRRGSTEGTAIAEPVRDEVELWLWARKQDTGPAYRIYLDRFPRGTYADEARLRQANRRADRAAAQRDEVTLGLTPAMRRMIESRLNQSGYESGSVDGKFDDRTRQALRLYQAANGQDVTGFLSRETIATLLNDTLGATEESAPRERHP